jgi:acyl-CoA thioesterase
MARIATTDDLLAGLRLNAVGEGAWEGPALVMPKANWVFGGLLAAQALVAASAGAPGLLPRSVSTRFLRRAEPGGPIRHEVRTVGRSRSFADHHVRISAGGTVVAEVAVLAHVPDDTDLEHGQPASDPPPPPDERAVLRGAGFDVVDLSAPPVHAREAAEARQRHWVRAPGTPPDDPITNAAVLLMASDVSLVAAAWRPIDGRSIIDVDTVVSYGLTFTVWFHRPATLARWHLLDATCPVAAAGRSLTFGSWYDADSAPVASVALDAVMRVRDERV